MPVKENPPVTARRVGTRERSREVANEIIATIEAAYADSGKKWFRIDHEFGEEGATSTASCIRRGFLRLKPRKGEQTVRVGKHNYPTVPPVEAEVGMNKQGTWSVWVRRPGVEG